MKLKVGDFVTIRHDLAKYAETTRSVSGIYIPESMHIYAGVKTVISQADIWEDGSNGQLYHIKADKGSWWWAIECFEDDRLRLVL